MKISCTCGNEMNSGETSDKFYFEIKEGISDNGKFFDLRIKCNECGRVRNRFIYF